jgi:hypothetical protein
MSIRESVLKRPIFPRSKSLTRGWETPMIPAAAAWVRPRSFTIFSILSMSSERTSRC